MLRKPLAPWLWLGIGAGAALAVCFLLRPNFAQLEADKRQLDDSVAVLHDRLALRAAADSALADSAHQAQQRAAHAVARGHDAQNRAQQAHLALETALGGNDTLRALVNDLTAAYDSVVSAKDQQIMALVRVSALKDRQIASRDSSISELQRTLAAAIQQRDDWRRAARQPILLRMAKTAGTMLAVGLTCRLVPGEAQPC